MMVEYWQRGNRKVWKDGKGSRGEEVANRKQEGVIDIDTITSTLSTSAAIDINDDNTKDHDKNPIRSLGIRMHPVPSSGSC